MEIKEEEYRSNRSRKLKNARKEDRENKVKEKKYIIRKDKKHINGGPIKNKA